jgi:hypothetical protein
MQTRAICLAAVIAATSICAASAQTTPDRPLSAIDWLDNLPKAQPVVAITKEPKVSSGANVPEINVMLLGGPAAKIIGLVPTSVSGLPSTIWSGSDATVLASTVASMPAHVMLPAAQAMLFTLLMAEADPAAGQSGAFDIARVDALLGSGALDPALALLEQIGPSRDPEVARRFVDASLLNETEQAACTLIQSNPALAPDYAYRIFCAARQGDWDTAALLLGTASALGTLSPEQTATLERFLDPDLFEGEPPLKRPHPPNPLMFRMHEALGQPITTRSWPIVYANADLRDIAGWKTQIDAAERLAQMGALPANQLLGIFSKRRPAASGEVWDRVAAVQRFETALNTKSPDAIAKTMLSAWTQMKTAGLSVVFSTLFADRLLAMELPQKLNDTAFAIVQNSPDYEVAVQTYPDAAAKFPFRAAVAIGEVTQAQANTPLETAIARGFSPNVADAAIIQTAKNGELGLAVLRTIKTLDAGAQGDMGQLSKALATLRALGLEDTSRRAALQMLIGQSQQ